MDNDKQTSRRDFLRGRLPTGEPNAQKGQNDSTNLRNTTDESSASNIDSPTYLLTASRTAMACRFSVEFPASFGAIGVEAATEALDVVDALETQMTVYRETSDVIEINQLAASELVFVESQLFELLQTAFEISELTDGAFDFTTGPLSKVWGFWKRKGDLPTNEAISKALKNVDYKQVLLDGAESTVSFLNPNTEIQLNGIGKGYALDRAAMEIDSTELTDYFIQGGQSSVVARGNDANRPDGGWSIGIRHPLRADQYLGEVVLRDMAVGTSGSATQSFYKQGKKYGHILDPRTGMPADGVFTSTVVASTAAVADAMATAFYVLGPEEVANICKKRQDIGAILVLPGTKRGDICIEVHNLDEETWNPA